MALNTIGDQARAFALQVASNRIKSTLTTLTKEVASGEVADVGQRLQGNTRALSEIENRISNTSQLQRNATEAAVQLQAMQNLFDGVRASTNGLGIALASEIAGEGTILESTRPVELAQAFEAIVQRLNGMDSNRFLLSGDASNVAPLSSASDILDALEGVTAGLTTARDVGDAVAAWFDAPPGAGGFLDTAYHGTLGTTQHVPVGAGTTIAITTSAAAPGVRDVLKAVATGAILSRGALAGQPGEVRKLLTDSGHRIMAADTTLLAEMGRIGLHQQTVERAGTANSSALATLELSRNDIRRADPYETAAALTEVQSQLESLYAVTARLSNLNLVDYLR